MPIWLFFSVAFFILAAAASGSVWYFTTTILAQVVTGAAYGQASAEAYVLTGTLLLVIFIIFFVLVSLISRPTRKLTGAIEAFAESGEHIPLVIPSFAPREIRKLVRSFVDLMARVETMHKRDTEVSRVKSDFISTAAHQLRTPLTGVRWALEALEKSELTEDQRSLVKNAIDKSHELVGVVGTLLDISAIESGKYKYTLAPADMDALVDEIQQDFQELAKSRNVSLTYERTSGLPLVRCDHERIKWVLNNLVENAIRYTPESGTVSLKTSMGVDRVFVAVRDTGIGITVQDRGNIFERFFRGGNAIAKENQGNGLGLYIARTIATDHGGDLNFRANENGPGTSFTLSLPVGGPAGA